MSFVLHTLHLFDFGEVQIIGEIFGEYYTKSAPTWGIATSTALVDEMYSKKPVINASPNDYHVINIFKDLFGDYHPNGNFKFWRVPYAEINATLISAVVDEVLAYVPIITTSTTTTTTTDAPVETSTTTTTTTDTPVETSTTTTTTTEAPVETSTTTTTTTDIPVETSTTTTTTTDVPVETSTTTTTTTQP
jgi:hypothetical protein